MKPLLLLGLVVGLGLGCRRDEPVREPGDAARCGQRPEHENNCVACSSQPSCGWCVLPQAGQVNCQATADAATSCREGFVASTSEGAAPLAAPPGAVE